MQVPDNIIVFADQKTQSDVIADKKRRGRPPGPKWPIEAKTCLSIEMANALNKFNKTNLSTDSCTIRRALSEFLKKHNCL